MSTDSLCTPKLVVDKITVAYGDVVVLDNFSLEVGVGETVAVVGPSGSGKSTLLRAVAGLEPLTSGRILLDGRDLAETPAHRRGMGLMFQDHALFPHLSVADNIGYGLDRADVESGARASRVDEMLSLVGLNGFGPRPTDRLSGGEAQRVALARALAPTPGLLMLDEPLGSLDRVLRHQLIDDLDVLLRRMGQTSLHVTHDQAEAFALADRVAVLAGGKLIAVGTPKQLWQNPRTRFVAEFLGRPNIWTLDPVSDRRVRWAEAGIDLDAPERLTSVAGEVVVPVDALSVDNEAVDNQAVDSASVRQQSPADQIRGTITASRFQNGRYRHRVGIHRGEPPVVVVVTDDIERPVGGEVRLTVDLNQAVVIGR